MTSGGFRIVSDTLVVIIIIIIIIFIALWSIIIIIIFIFFIFIFFIFIIIIIIVMQGEPKKARLFLRSDNFLTTNDRKACDTSKVSEFCPE